jgi:hypothetical protein
MKLQIVILLAFLILFPTNYIATTEQGAYEVSARLIPDGGKPDNICGPLSIQILKDLGYVDEQIPIKSFWFLTPWDEYTQRTIIEPAFPVETSLWYRSKESIAKFDFEEFPLQKGDLLFLPYDYSCGGTFSHILAVTDVRQEIPYTITNHLTHDGWRISELPLYGVKDSYFDTITDRRNTMTIGTTGFCGFYLWRNLNYEKTIRLCSVFRLWNCYYGPVFLRPYPSGHGSRY